WMHLTLRLALDPIVADRSRRIQRIGDVLFGDVRDVAGVHRVGRPHTGVAVCLQFDPDRRALGSLCVASGMLEDAKEILDVVAVLVCEHIGLCEGPTAGSEAGCELAEEPEIDVDLLVGWTVERARLRGR